MSDIQALLAEAREKLLEALAEGCRSEALVRQALILIGEDDGKKEGSEEGLLNT